MRFIVRPGAVQHQNGANVGAVVQGLHIFVACVRGWVVNLPSQAALAAVRRRRTSTNFLTIAR